VIDAEGVDVVAPSEPADELTSVATDPSLDSVMSSAPTGVSGTSTWPTIVAAAGSSDESIVAWDDASPVAPAIMLGPVAVRPAASLAPPDALTTAADTVGFSVACEPAVAAAVELMLDSVPERAPVPRALPAADAVSGDVAVVNVPCNFSEPAREAVIAASAMLADELAFREPEELAEIAGKVAASDDVVRPAAAAEATRELRVTAIAPVPLADPAEVDVIADVVTEAVAVLLLVSATEAVRGLSVAGMLPVASTLLESNALMPAKVAVAVAARIAVAEFDVAMPAMIAASVAVEPVTTGLSAIVISTALAVAAA
jgi:hypothetical protein